MRHIFRLCKSEQSLIDEAPARGTAADFRLLYTSVPPARILAELTKTGISLLAARCRCSTLHQSISLRQTRSPRSHAETTRIGGVDARRRSRYQMMRKASARCIIRLIAAVVTTFISLINPKITTFIEAEQLQRGQRPARLGIWLRTTNRSLVRITYASNHCA